jgi:hypothetical protein
MSRSNQKVHWTERRSPGLGLFGALCLMAFFSWMLFLGTDTGYPPSFFLIVGGFVAFTGLCAAVFGYQLIRKAIQHESPASSSRDVLVVWQTNFSRLFVTVVIAALACIGIAFTLGGIGIFGGHGRTETVALVAGPLLTFLSAGALIIRFWYGWPRLVIRIDAKGIRDSRLTPPLIGWHEMLSVEHSEQSHWISIKMRDPSGYFARLGRLDRFLKGFDKALAMADTHHIPVTFLSASEEEIIAAIERWKPASLPFTCR